MTESPANAGRFCWFELSTSDSAAAKAFYAEIFGWTHRDDETGEHTYTMLFKDGKGAGAMHENNERPPHWGNYVSVADVEASAAKVKEHGGQVVMEPFDVGTYGRMAVCADPGGAAFCLWQAGEHCGAEHVDAPGGVCWNELMTRDVKQQETFYTAVFGWGSQFSEMPMPYTIFMNGENMVAGMMEPAPEIPADVPSHWMIYFLVDNCDETTAKIKELGGAVMAEPFDVPDTGRIAVVADPQGAAFGVMSPPQ